MDVNEILMACKSKRSTILFPLLMVFLGLSIMFLTTCGSDNGGSQPVVQATVYFQENGPYAIAFVLDEVGNFISNAVLTINDRPMNLADLVDGEESQDAALYYFLDLSDLKGGDSVRFMARHSDGHILYAPPTAQIPMPVEVIEPTVDQTITPGQEVQIRWTGGEGATRFTAGYAAIEGTDQLWEQFSPGSENKFTIPPGRIGAGLTIFAVSAITGDISLFSAYDDETVPDTSYFSISRATAIEVSILEPQSLRLGTDCGETYLLPFKAATICRLEFAALGIGAIIWEARRVLDMNCIPYGKETIGKENAFSYCFSYSLYGGSHTAWRKGCRRCRGDTEYKGNIGCFHDVPPRYFDCGTIHAKKCGMGLVSMKLCGDVCNKQCP